jgi:parvulin-like peptidyl-prolyl isomerase
MVLFFRKQVYRNVFRAFLILTAASMLVGVGLTSFFKKSAYRSSAIATVDGEDIEYREFARREKAKREQLALLRYQFEQMGMPDQGLFDIDSKKLAFSGLLEEILLNRVARSLDIQLNEEYVASKLSDNYYVTRELSEFFPSYLAVSQSFDNEALTRMLRSNGMSIADFETFVEHDLERKVVKDIALNSLYNPAFVVKRKYAQDYAAKKFSSMTLSLDTFLTQAKKSKPADDELQRFFNENSKNYIVPEKRSGTLWEFSPEQYGIAVSDAQVREHYENNKDKFIASPVKVKVRRILFKVASEEQFLAAKVKAEAVHAELAKNSELFAAKAQQFSDDKATAKNGGTVDFFARGDREPNFEKATFRLKEDGEISPIVQTKDGLEIIQRVARRSAEYKGLAAVSSEIKNLLTNLEFKNRFDEDVERVLADAQQEPAVLGTFAAKKKAKQSELSLAERDDSLKGEKLFTLKEGFSSYLDQGKGVILQLRSIHKSHAANFADIKTAVVNDFYKVKAEKDLMTALSAARQKADTQSLTTLAQEYHINPRTIGWLKSEDSDQIKSLTKEGFPVVQMLQMEKSGSVLGYYDGTKGYLVKLDAIEQVKDQEFGSKKQAINNELERSHSVVALNGFVASLARNVTLKTHEKSLDSDEFETEV